MSPLICNLIYVNTLNEVILSLLTLSYVVLKVIPDNQKSPNLLLSLYQNFIECSIFTLSLIDSNKNAAL